jgi:hypothetical protein
MRAPCALQRVATIGILLGVLSCAREAPLVVRPAAPSRSLVLKNVRVFDAPGARLLDGLHDVVVREGRIAAITPAGGPAEGTPAIDGHGGTLLPGLVDVHTHTGSTPGPPWKVGGLPDVGANLAAFLYAGVTTVLDLGSLAPAVFDTRAQVRSGALLGPRRARSSDRIVVQLLENRLLPWKYVTSQNTIIDDLTSVRWFERINSDAGPGIRDRTTRLTVLIDRADLSRTASALYAPQPEATSAEPPPLAWTTINPPQEETPAPSARTPSRREKK